MQLHPESWNVYDSLAEAYMNSGEKTLAIQNYQKSLELNPKNNNAAAMLKKLQNN
jgi:cytochrome c-type biogenesis protein CcmH/NrfG